MKAMRAMTLVAASLLTATSVKAQSQPDYVLVSGAPNGRPGVNQDSVVYWNTARLVRAGDQVEVELRFVTQGLGATRPMSSSRRYRISCEWAAQSFHHPANAGDGWSAPRFINADMLVSTANQACGLVAPAEASRFSSHEAAYEDAVKRLGFESLEAAMALPEGQPFITSSGGLYKAAPAGGERESWRLVYGLDGDHRAVFLKSPESVAPGASVEGRSMWLMNVGQPAEARSYALRDFRADCAARTIAVATVDSWPTDGVARGRNPETRSLAALLNLSPAEGGASAALLAAACSPPAQGVAAASIDEVVAFAGTPAEDPAFAVLSQQTISHDDMRWLRAPDPETVTAAYPQGALRPGETGLTTVACVVTRDYALTACAPTYHAPPRSRISASAHDPGRPLCAGPGGGHRGGYHGPTGRVLHPLVISRLRARAAVDPPRRHGLATRAVPVRNSASPRPAGPRHRPDDVRHHSGASARQLHRKLLDGRERQVADLGGQGAESRF